MDSMFRLGRIFGFEVQAQVLGVVVWVIFGLQFGGRDLLSGIVYIATLASAILFHELGHAYVARSRGMFVPKIVLHAFGGLTLWQGRASWKDKLWITAAGPAVNLALAVLGFGLLNLASVARLPLLAEISSMVFFVNLALGIFNLFPIYPLDGGSLLHTLLLGKRGPRTASIAYLVGLVFAVLLGAYALMTRSIFLVLFMGYFGWMNWQKWREEGPREGFKGWMQAASAARRTSQRGNDQRWLQEHRAEIDAALRQSLEQGIHSLSSRQKELLQRARRSREWSN